MVTRKPRDYFTLLVFDPEAKRWGQEFGDYVRSCVVGEMQTEYRDKGVPAKRLMIIRTSDNAQDIQGCVDQLNAAFKATEANPRPVRRA